jgi:hypothetical protein
MGVNNMIVNEDDKNKEKHLLLRVERLQNESNLTFEEATKIIQLSILKDIDITLNGISSQLEP